MKLPSVKLGRTQTENDLIVKANPVGKNFFSPHYKEFMEYTKVATTLPVDAVS